MTIETLITAYQSAGGSLSGPDLDRAALLSWGYLLSATLGRIAGEETVTPELLQCFRALVELVHGDVGGEALQSQTLGDWRVEYRDGTGGAPLPQRAERLIRRYLGASALLYRGWPPC